VSGGACAEGAGGRPSPVFWTLSGWTTPRRPYVRDGTAWIPVREGYRADVVLPERKTYRGRGYHLVGDVALLRGDAPTEEEIAAIVHHCHPRGVIWVKGYAGKMRIPNTELLYGTAGEVRHREEGYTFILDRVG